MRRFVRFAPVAVALALVLVGLTLARPTWASDVGLDWWNAPELSATEEAAERDAHHLDHRNEVLRWRIAAKNRIANAVLAQRLTLVQAAAWFDRLNNSTRDCPFRDPRDADSAGADGLCRQVLRWVRAEVEYRKVNPAVRGDPGEEQLKNCEEELERMLLSGEPLLLPAADSLEALTE
jgi:hypothetical protein